MSASARLWRRVQLRAVAWGVAVTLLMVVAGVVAAAEAPPTFLQKWGQQGTGDGMGEPRAIAVGPDGSVYVTDIQNIRVQRFSSIGAYLGSWGHEGSGDGAFVERPIGIDAGTDGRVYVGDLGSRIQTFDQSGMFLGRFAGGGVNSGIAIDPTGAYIYAASAGGVAQYTVTGNLVRAWITTNSPLAANQGIAVGPSGNVYVAEGGAAQVIYKYTADGVLLGTIGSSGSGDGQLSSPWGVAVDADENVYVCDALNSRIQKFSSAGVFLTKWGSLGTGDGQFQGPIDIAVDDSGNVYVVDRFNYRIQKFGYVATPTQPTSWGAIKARYKEPARPTIAP